MVHRTPIAAAVASLAMLLGAAAAQAAPTSGDGGELSPAGKAAVAGMNAFSLDLYKRTLKPEQNLFLSPASVSMAMSLAYRGAVGKTADELRKVMRYDAPPAEYLRASGEVFETMNASGDGHVLQSANAIWVQDDLPLKPDYLADVQTYLKSGLQRTNFRADPEQARGEINGWVSSATNGRITDLISAGSLDTATSAVLVNAIYWKGAWESPFDPADTKVETFTVIDGARRKTPLMHRECVEADACARFPVIERDGVQAIQLPYEGDTVSMVIFLPRSPTGLADFESGLNSRALTRWLQQLDGAQPRYTSLILPKMHVEWQDDLKGTLIRVGGRSAFSDAADFSGMAEISARDQAAGVVGYKISHVDHEAWLDVDEAGAEAAAATGVTMTEIVITSDRVENPIVFRADRPFLFLLRDNRTGLILFMGRYVTPSN